MTVFGQNFIRDEMGDRLISSFLRLCFARELDW
jgi:hypothetical protein